MISRSRPEFRWRCAFLGRQISARESLLVLALLNIYPCNLHFSSFSLRGFFCTNFGEYTSARLCRVQVIGIWRDKIGPIIRFRLLLSARVCANASRWLPRRIALPREGRASLRQMASSRLHLTAIYFNLKYFYLFLHIWLHLRSFTGFIYWVPLLGSFSWIFIFIFYPVPAIPGEVPCYSVKVNREDLHNFLNALMCAPPTSGTSVPTVAASHAPALANWLEPNRTAHDDTKTIFCFYPDYEKSNLFMI